eukprot:1655768-Rhodomonas_salina.2
MQSLARGFVAQCFRAFARSFARCSVLDGVVPPRRSVLVVRDVGCCEQAIRWCEVRTGTADRRCDIETLLCLCLCEDGLSVLGPAVLSVDCAAMLCLPCTAILRVWMREATLADRSERGGWGAGREL